MATLQKVSVKINGIDYEREVESRLTLADFLRNDLELTGTHVGCEHGVCGACTIQMNGVSIRSCLMLAVQVDGAELMTVEGLMDPNTGKLHAIQEAFVEEHGMQCGFCTPGFLMSTLELLANNPQPNDEEIKDALDGNLCRCTGYESIIKSVHLAAKKVKEGNVDCTWYKA